METPRRLQRPRTILAWCIAPALLILPGFSGLAAQELGLKRDLSPRAADPCAAVEGAPSSRGADPDAGGRSAEQLVAEASQASILGDRDRARALLREAVRVDPDSPSLRYRLGRLLEDSEEETEALAQYCRYLALAPDGAEADEVRGRLDRVGGRPAGSVEAAMADFEEGMRAYDEGDFETAALHFSGALETLPEWEEARFNRALSYERAGETDRAAADFERYLELRPDAPERRIIERQVEREQVLSPPRHGPATILVTGILMPGMGHIYSGNPETGLIVLAGAAASAAAALLYRKIEVECLSLPVDGRCPPDQERGRRESRPLLTPGLGIAAAITIGGAVHAFLLARESPVRISERGSLEAPLPGASFRGIEAALMLEAAAPAAWDGIRTGVRVTF